jgi:outer membrane immunogenic protein
MKIRAFALGAAFAAMSSATLAADPMMMTYDSSSFDFTGFYLGVYGGAAAAPGFSGLAGGLGGFHIEFAPDWLFGAEVQAGYNSAAGGSFDALGLLHVGYDAGDLLLYAAAGAGILGGAGSGAAGGGVEIGVTDDLSIRGEALATTPFTAFAIGGRGTLSLIWHM